MSLTIEGEDPDHVRLQDELVASLSRSTANETAATTIIGLIGPESDSTAQISAANDNITGNSSSPEAIPIYMQHMTTVLVILHLSVFISGLVGNTLVCLSVYRNKSLQTVTNYYIVNLAVADFLVIMICLPPTVYWDLNLTWNFGLVLCKLVLYLQVSSANCSKYVPRRHAPKSLEQHLVARQFVTFY